MTDNEYSQFLAKNGFDMINEQNMIKLQCRRVYY